MREGRRAFQFRARRVEDDGSDFENFVFECFRIAKEERGFAKRLARGRDGAIDLIDRISEPGSATVAECKFIGSDKAEDATARWADVYRHLRDHLPALHADSAKSPKSPYRAWLDPKRPVTRYRFCVTVTMNDRELGELEQRIRDDFAALVAAGVASLRPLAEREGAVRVLRWDWFDALLEEHPSLAFRWFRGLPVGVELFEEEGGKEATFRNFLTRGELPYFSRDQYAREGAGALERGESALVSSLALGDPQALLITGPGGAGKTRLSWELATALGGPAYGFDVYRLGQGCRFESVTDLAARYPGQASILLLIDYAEAVPRLGEIAEAVAYLSANAGHRMRLIGTCRSSATNLVHDSLSALDPELKGLGSQQSGEDKYARWVAHAILSLEAFPEPGELEQLCHGVPALAAFALFLFRRHRAQFNNQFGALHGLHDFDRWTNHRIAMLLERLGQRPAHERMLAQIAVTLPMPLGRYRSMIATAGTLLDALCLDRWIEFDRGNYAAAHDVLADALASRWLFEADHGATVRVIDLLDEAARNDDLPQALIVLARLAPHSKFSEIDGATVVDALLERHPNAVGESCEILLGGPLLRFEEKLDLLHRSILIRNCAKREESLGVSLSLLAAEATRRKLIANATPPLATLADILDELCNRQHFSNMILRRAYAFDPARFRELAYTDIAARPHAEQTHFLLVQMLRSGEPAEALRDATRQWLDRNAQAPRASFVYRAWLDRDGSIEAVTDSLLAWVAEHGTKFEARFVYRVWLNRDGSIEAVTDSLLAWVAVHGTTLEARFVYRAWLNRDGSIEAVTDSLLAWVAEHGTTLEARFVYKAWLDRAGSIEAVTDSLLAWVAEHGTVWEASYVYRAWLNRDGSIEAVTDSLLAWVAEHGTTFEAQFVYRAWLNRDGSIEAVTDSLLAWVAVHGTTLEAQFVYKAWLDRDGSIEAVTDSLLAWVAEHGTTLEAQFVYKAWLDRDGSIEAVTDSLLAWVAEEHGAAREASHVYKAWLDRKANFESIRDQTFRWVLRWPRDEGMIYLTKRLCKMHDLPEEIILAISRWSLEFSDHEDSLDRIVTLCGHVHAASISTAGLLSLIQNMEAVIEINLHKESLVPRDRSHIWALCASLMHPLYANNNSIAATRVIVNVVISAKVFVPGTGTSGADYLTGRQNWILLVVWRALRSGELSVERHLDALADLARWARAADGTSDGTRVLLRRMNEEFASPAWL